MKLKEIRDLLGSRQLNKPSLDYISVNCAKAFRISNIMDGWEPRNYILGDIASGYDPVETARRAVRTYVYNNPGHWRPEREVQDLLLERVEGWILEMLGAVIAAPKNPLSERGFSGWVRIPPDHIIWADSVPPEFWASEDERGPILWAHLV